MQHRQTMPHCYRRQRRAASLTINGVSQGKASFTNLNGSSYTETLDVGSDLGSPVSSVYQVPSRFAGKIDEVTIQLK